MIIKLPVIGIFSYLFVRVTRYYSYYIINISTSADSYCSRAIQRLPARLRRLCELGGKVGLAFGSSLNNYVLCTDETLPKHLRHRQTVS